MSVWDPIERYVPGGHGSFMGRYLERAYLSEFGRDTREQSAINIVYMLGTQSGPLEGEAGFHIFGPSDERYHIRGGNERLPDAIVARLPRGTSVSIPGWRRSSAGQRPGHADGRERRPTRAALCGRVILALPFTRLRDVDYRRARFSGVKRVAIEQLGYGRHAKLQIPFTHRIWRTRGPWPGISDGTIYTDLDFQNTWDTTRGQPGESGILVAYLGGTPALAAAAGVAYTTTLESPKTRRTVAATVAQIDRVFPGIASLRGPRDDGLHVPRSVHRRQLRGVAGGPAHGFRRRRGGTEGPIHFAGEHTSLDQQGFMEGGAATGLRAAREVLHATRSGAG